MPAQPMQSAPPPDTGKRSGRLTIWIVTILLALFAVWSLLWYLGAFVAQNVMDRAMQREIRGTRILSCNDQTTGGYPFHFSLSCSSYTVTHPGSGWQITGGPLTATWKIYSPNALTVQLRTKATLANDTFGKSLSIASNVMYGRVYFDLADFTPKASFEANDAALTSSDPIIADYIGKITARKLSALVQPTPEREGDIDLQIATDDFSPGEFPLFSGQLSLTAVKGLEAAREDPLHPTRVWLEKSGRIENIDGHIEIGQKTLKLGGDIAFDQMGQANGLLALRILNPGIDSARVTKTLTAKRDGLNGPLTALQLMGKPVRDGKLIGSEVEISLSDGYIKAGLFPLGRLPALK